MRIATFARGTEANLEKRKLQLARREMDQAYKKNAKYADATKNPMLHMLENLLSGKIEKELHENDIADKQYEVLEEPLQRDEKLQLEKMKQDMRNGLSTEYELGTSEQSNRVVDKDVPVLTMDTSGVDGSDYLKNRNSLPITNNVGEFINPSPLDLRVASSAASQIQVGRAELTEESFEEHETDRIPFEGISFDVNIPSQFLTSVERNAKADTVFGKDLEKLILNRTYNKAKAVYTNHIGMVNNGYRSYNEPLFTRTA
mgnify:CR=1 FL=1